MWNKFKTVLTKGEWWKKKSFWASIGTFLLLLSALLLDSIRSGLITTALVMNVLQIWGHIFGEAPSIGIIDEPKNK